jgi:alpha-L-fucosidase 2
MRYLVSLFSICIFLWGCNEEISDTSNTIWFNKPATYFEESFVMGNGKTGASVFGGVHTDSIFLNDATLWAGEPVDPYMNPDAYQHIPSIREALENEDYELADRLNRNVQGSFSESFAPLGTMFLNFSHDAEPEQYYRELNISQAVSKVNYTIGDIEFTREYFVSHPDKVIVIKLTASGKGALNFDIDFSSLLKYNITTDNNVFTVNGYAPYHAEPGYRGDMPDAVQFDADRGTRFTTIIDIIQTDGRVTSDEKSIALEEGSEATILVSIATSFNGFDKDPAREGLDDKQLAKRHLANASTKSFKELKQNHLDDYQHFFNRVSLNLGESNAPDLPMDERLKRYAEGHEDKNLEILYFQFGRYLLISSSRTDGVPANLQGIWNHYIRPPWSSNYTVNINVEENYWLAENTNLSELHAPLMTFIDNISRTGEITAKTFYGVDAGWVACHNSDIWAMSNPVGDFGQGHPVWANWNMGGAWLSTHLWEHYIFTGDEEFLRSKGYPLMKGAAEFCLGWLVEDSKGELITSPSTSPENMYLTPEGYRGATFYGGTADLAMIRELFIQTIRASEVLDEDPEFRERLDTALYRLHPYHVGSKGNLQEWYYDWEDVDPQHRHQSHLFGLYPGHHITPSLTPEFAEACRRSLEIKGDESTGWSKGWRINLWARLYDGNHAYKMYRTLLRYIDPSGLDTNYSRGGGTYPNLLDGHPPFQIDGNFGGAAGVAEMLIQSSENEIRLLPALPDAWESGSVKGLVARGGFEVSMEWKNKTLVNATVLARKGGKTTLNSDNKQMELALEEGESIDIDW